MSLRGRRPPEKLLIVDATTRCNQFCAFCFEKDIHFTRPDATSAWIKGVARRAREQGFTDLTFIGGEITLVPWLFEAVAEIRGLGMGVGVVTNGLRLSSRRFCERLLGAVLTHVELSLLAGDAAQDLALCGLAGGFRARVRALDNLRAARPASPDPDSFLLFVNVVLAAANLSSLERLVRLAHEGGADFLVFKMLSLTPSVKDPRLVPPLETLAPALAAAMRRCESLGLDFMHGRVPACAIAPEFRARRVPAAAAGVGHVYERGGGDRFDLECFGEAPPPAYLSIFGDAALKPAARV